MMRMKLGGEQESKSDKPLAEVVIAGRKFILSGADTRWYLVLPFLYSGLELDRKLWFCRFLNLPQLSDFLKAQNESHTRLYRTLVPALEEKRKLITQKCKDQKAWAHALCQQEIKAAETKRVQDIAQAKTAAEQAEEQARAGAELKAIAAQQAAEEEAMVAAQQTQQELLEQQHDPAFVESYNATITASIILLQGFIARIDGEISQKSFFSNRIRRTRLEDFQMSAVAGGPPPPILGVGTLVGISILITTITWYFMQLLVLLIYLAILSSVTTAAATAAMAAPPLIVFILPALIAVLVVATCMLFRIDRGEHRFEKHKLSSFSNTVEAELEKIKGIPLLPQGSELRMITKKNSSVEEIRGIVKTGITFFQSMKRQTPSGVDKQQAEAKQEKGSPPSKGPESSLAISPSP